MTDIGFVAEWRQRQSLAFDLARNSSARSTVALRLWGQRLKIYANANLSIYSAQSCNASCPFCVEELRPASRGRALSTQKHVETDDGRYFAALSQTLDALRPLAPSVSVTGGEPSIDPRLPRILRTLQTHGARRRTVTTNGSGLLEPREDRLVLDWILATGVQHLNISRAHPDQGHNARLMGYLEGLCPLGLREVVTRAKRGGTRVRLSCVLLRDGVQSFGQLLEYLAFARELGADNVIFRQLMHLDARAVRRNHVVAYSERKRVDMLPLLEQVGRDPRFQFKRQVMGYYYYVEVWRYRDMDVVFEGADLAQLDATRRHANGVLHELVFHPDARLTSTWQPWDGVLGPPPSATGSD
jgi:cyclic pyranopterin phosphate synthase